MAQNGVYRYLWIDLALELSCGLDNLSCAPSSITYFLVIPDVRLSFLSTLLAPSVSCIRSACFVYRCPQSSGPKAG